MKGKKNWRLSKTLKRNIEIRPIEQEDIKYAWAAYKKGSLKDIGGPFNDDGLSALQFKDVFELFVLKNSDAAWTVIANTKDGRLPIGFVFGGWAPQEVFMIIVGIVWFSWASKRNVVEATVCFFNKIRRQFKCMGFAVGEHKILYEVCCMHGVMRRVGTSYLSGQPTAIFEVKSDVVPV